MKQKRLRPPWRKYSIAAVVLVGAIIMWNEQPPQRWYTAFAFGSILIAEEIYWWRFDREYFRNAASSSSASPSPLEAGPELWASWADPREPVPDVHEPRADS